MNKNMYSIKKIAFEPNIDDEDSCMLFVFLESNYIEEITIEKFNQKYAVILWDYPNDKREWVTTENEHILRLKKNLEKPGRLEKIIKILRVRVLEKILFDSIKELSEKSGRWKSKIESMVDKVIINDVLS